MSEVSSYLERLKIKKTWFGGFDREAVYTSMKELSALYQKELVQIREEKERLEQKSEAAAEKLEQAGLEIERLKAQLEEEQKNRSQYEMRFNVLSQAIDAVNASRDGILEESKKKAGALLSQANEKLEALNQACLLQERRRSLIQSKVSDARQKFSLITENIRSVLTKMLAEVDEYRGETLVQDPGREQEEDEESAQPAGAEDKADSKQEDQCLVRADSKSGRQP